MPEFEPHRTPLVPGAGSNPYAAPEAELIPPAGFDARVDRGEPLEPFSIDAVMRRAWTVYRRDFGLCVGVVLTTALLPLAFAIVAGIFTSTLAARRAPPIQVAVVNGTTLVVATFLPLWLGIGQSLVLLRLARGEPASFGDAFRGGRYVARVFGGTIIFAVACGYLIGCIVFIGGNILYLACGVVGPAGEGWEALWLALAWPLAFLLIVPALSVRFLQFPFIVIDQFRPPFSALGMSARLTRGHTLELLALALLAGLIVTAGFLACFVGLIFTAPFGLLINACGHALLTGTRVPVAATKPADIVFFES